MKKASVILSILLVLVLAVATQINLRVTSAQEVTPTPTTDHSAHHGGSATATPNPQSGMGMGMDMGSMGGEDTHSMMQGMMGMMMDMEMSEEMHGMMSQMQGMMDMMGMDMSSEMHDMMMSQMQGMMDMMIGMDMSEEMHDMMSQMQGMMGMMMGGDHSQHEQGNDTVDHSQHQQQGNNTVDHSQHESSGHAHAAISAEGVEPATENIGGQPLEPTVVDGVKVFEITAKPVLWTLTEGVQVVAWTYNGTVPGPMIRVTEGEQVRIIVTNELPEPTTVHWHGIQVPNAMDGIPGLTQDPIQTGETFTYEFVAKPAGTFMYHTHFNSDVQMNLGLYAPFIIDPAEPTEPAPDVDFSIMLSESRVVDGETFAAMPMAAMEPNYFTFNGHAAPSIEPLEVKQGQRVRIRLYGAGQFTHPIHLHGVPFKVVAIDGIAVAPELQQSMDTISVAPGQRFDIEFVATELGQWMLHCHIAHHTMNADGSEGGMMMVINVTE